MKTRQRLLSAHPVACVIAVLLAWALPPPASADSATWNGNADAQWSNVGNWDGPPAAVPGAGNTATFSRASVNTTIDLGPGVTLLNLSILTADAARYTIGAGASGSQPLTISAGGAVTVGASVTNDQSVLASLALGGATTFAINAASNRLAVAGPVTGAGNLTKTGLGYLWLIGDNTYSGGTTLGNGTSNTSGSDTATTGSGGFVVVGHNHALGSGAVSAKGAQLRAGIPGLTLSNAVTIDGGALRFSGANDLTLAGAINSTGAREIGNYSGSRTLLFTGPVNMNTYTLNFMGINGAASNGTTEVIGPITGSSSLVMNGVNDNGLLILSGDNAGYTGNTLANAGTLRVAHSNALVNTGSITMNDTDAKLELANGITLSRPLTVGDTGNNKVLRAQLGASAEFAGPITVNETTSGNFDLTADAGSTLTVSGPIAGVSAAKMGEGTVILPSANTLTNTFVLGNATSNVSGNDTATALSGGFLVVCHSNALGAGTVTFKGAQLRAGVPGLVIPNPLSVDQGALRFSGTNDLELAGAATLVSGSDRGFGNYSGGRQLTLSGTVAVTNGFALVVQGNDNASQNGPILFAGAITGNGDFQVDDSYDGGVAVLAGNNSFTGSTTVSSGTLRLDYSAQDNSKLSDTASLAVASAALELVGGTHLEQVAATTVSGDSAITRSSGAAVLALGELTVKGSLRLSAEDVASTTSANVNGLLGGVTVTVGGVTRWAANSGVSDGGSGYLIRAFGGSLTDVDRLGGVIPDDATLNIRIANGGVSGDVTLTAPSNRVGTLTMDASDGPATLSLGGGTLAVGGDAGSSIILNAGAGGLTIGTAAGDGTLTAGGEANGTPTGLLLANDSTASDLTVHAAIPNNGTDVVTLSKTGPGKVILTGTNTYSGGTRITGGILQVGDGGATGQLGTGIAQNDGQLLFSRGAGSGDLLVTASIIGSGSVTHGGAANARLILRGTGSGYAGGTTLNGGILTAQDSATDNKLLALGTGLVTLNGGTLEAESNGSTNDPVIVTGDGTTGNDLSVTANATLLCQRYNATNNRTNNTIRFNDLTLGGCQLTFTGANKYRASFAGDITLTGPVTFNSTYNDTEAWLALDGPITDNGSGYGITKLGLGTLFLSGNNTYSGGTVLGNVTANTVAPDSTTATASSGGFVLLGHNNALGTGPVLERGLQIRAACPGLVIPNSVTITNGGFRFGGTNSLEFSGAFTLVSASRDIANYTVNKTLTLNAIDLNGQNVTFIGITGAATNGTTVVRGCISNSKTAGAVYAKTAFCNGRLILSGASTYVNSTIIESQATLQLGDGGPTGSLNPSSDIQNSGTLAFNRSDTITQGADFDGLLSGTGTVSVEGSGAVVFTGTNAYSGATVIRPDATLRLGAGGTTGSLSLSSPITTDGTLAFNRSDTVTQGTHFDAAFGGAGGVTQAGAGSAILTGTNFYTGPTAVQSGTLLINGDQSAATGLITVSSGATLGGTGACGGTCTVPSGAILSPGQSGAGTLTVAALTLQADAVYRWDVSPATNDTVAVTGDLALPSGFTLNVHRLAPGALRQKTLFTYGGTYSGPDSCEIQTTGDAAAPYRTFHDAANQRVLLVAVQTGSLVTLR